MATTTRDIRESGLLGVLSRVAFVLAILAILAAVAFPAPRLLYSYNLEHFAAFYLLAVAAAVANPLWRLRHLTAGLVLFAVVVEGARLFWTPAPLVLQRGYADVGGIMAGYAPIVAERIRARIQVLRPPIIPPAETPPGGAVKPCPFCAIAGGEGDGDVVYEDAATLAFLDHSPLAIGHCLLIPRAHVETLFDADAATLTALALATQKVGTAIRGAMAADGLFVAQNNVISQSVPHIHVHLVPRWKGDKLFSGGSMVWRRVRYRDDAHRTETAAWIRNGFG